MENHYALDALVGSKSPVVFRNESESTSPIESLLGLLREKGLVPVLVSQGCLVLLLLQIPHFKTKSSVHGEAQLKNEKLKIQIEKSNIASANQSAKELVLHVVSTSVAISRPFGTAHSLDVSPLATLLSQEPFAAALKNLINKKNIPKFDSVQSAITTSNGIKALSEVCAEDSSRQSEVVDLGGLCLLRRLLLCNDYENLAAVHTAYICRPAARLLAILSLRREARKVVVPDEPLCKWLEDCANGKIRGCNDPKLRSYARATLLNIFCINHVACENCHVSDSDSDSANSKKNCPRYGDGLFLINPERHHWKHPCTLQMGESSSSQDTSIYIDAPQLDIVFVHGLRGGPYKSWRIPQDKPKSKKLVNIDAKAEKLRTFWPCEWLQSDIPEARVFTVKYKTNLTAWSGATLPLQDISSMLLEKLVTAGIGDRSVVFVTHSMGGLIVKQMLYEASTNEIDNLVNNTVGLVFYSCPHFGSKLANMPWAMRTIFRPSPVVGELRIGSPRLAMLNNFVSSLYKKYQLKVLSFCETKKTPIVGRHKGWPISVKIVSQKSANPGFGEVVELESTDHINSCKPRNREHPAYARMLEFLNKMKTHRK